MLIVADWIAEVETERRRIEAQLGRKPTARNLTTSEIRALIGRLREIAGVLGEVNPQDKRAIYDELGVELRYEPETRAVHLAAGAPHVLRVGVGGGT